MLLQIRRAVIALGCLAFGVSGFTQQPTTRRFTALEHLDNDTVVLKQSGELLTFLATWIGPDLAEFERVTEGNSSYVRNAAGERVSKYPEKMLLRITVGNKSVIDDLKPFEVETDLRAEELASNVHFRLRIYRGLEYRAVEPISTRMIGVPKDIPYNERIYLVEFSLKDVPIEDRLMIEVLDPRDQRVAKFSVSML